MRRLLVEEGADIKKEYYVAALTGPRDAEGRLDGQQRRRHGHRGSRPQARPEKILKVFVDPLVGLTDAQARNWPPASACPPLRKPRRSTAQEALHLLHGHRRQPGRDQPLIPEGNGNIKALDAKFNFDANALFRHPEIVAYRDLDEEDPAEIEASVLDLSYISLDGNIGCLVNGAGLAMATMDTIKLFGGEPANFLDVGGGATAEKVTEAFKIMLKNKSVKGILVNIFGGIMKCDTIAEGVIQACKAVNPRCRWWCA